MYAWVCIMGDREVGAWEETEKNRPGRGGHGRLHVGGTTGSDRSVTTEAMALGVGLGGY